MRCQNSRETFTDEIPSVAERLPAALEDTGEGSVPEGIAKGNDSNNPVLDCASKTVGGDVSDLSSLAVG